MRQQVDINIEHLTRVEGHGNIIVNVKEGRIEKCQWQVPEAPRFFESMVRGRHYSEVARITSRICGICSIGHTLASLKATENALDIQISEQSLLLRQLLKHAENFDSNVLHVYLLAAPDLLGVKSVFPLVKSDSAIVKRALGLKRLAHEWGSLIGGRTTHPTLVIPGGFSKVPARRDLQALREKLLNALPELDASVEILLAVIEQIPDFRRPTEYIALSNDAEYAIYNGEVQALLPDGSKQRYPIANYLDLTNEYVSEWSTAKYCKHRLDSYMVGALARFNNNYQQLCEPAKQAARRLGLGELTTNPYMNTIAQLVELVHDAHAGVAIIDQLLDQKIKAETPVTPNDFHSGVGAVEVPRGILFHEYHYDENGICQGGNYVIPTNQNHANIQNDFEKLVPELLQQEKNETEMELALEMLVRAYDPCISCSAHYLDIRFVR